MWSNPNRLVSYFVILARGHLYRYIEGGMEHAYGYNYCNTPRLRCVSYTVRYAKKLLNQIVYLFSKGFCMALKTGI